MNNRNSENPSKSYNRSDKNKKGKETPIYLLDS